MNDLPRQTLIALIARYGATLCDDPRRCNALLFDACRDCQREINALMTALDEKIHIDLSNALNPHDPALLAYLMRRLQERRALSEASARWAVESWVLALKPNGAPQPTSIATPSYSPSRASGAQREAVKAVGAIEPLRQNVSPTPANRSAETLLPVRGYWRELWRRFNRNKRAVFGLFIIGGMFLTGIFTEELSPYCHTLQNLRGVNQPPSLVPFHPFGTDDLGRDLASRIIWGARTAIVVAVSVVTLNVTIGLLFGMAAGYFGGKVDTLIMRFADFLFAFPDFLFLIFIAATLRPPVVSAMREFGASMGWKRGTGCTMDYVAFADFIVVIGALSFIGWPGFARLVRGQFLSLRKREFVESAHAMGAGAWRIILRHILPNALPPLIVSMALSMGGAIMAETGLSFIGVGIQAPNPSWGTALLENYTYWRTRPYMIIIPGGVIALVILSFNFLGQGLNEALNPKTQ